jgi:hypothetical protein
MRIELDDAIKIYAKACRSWYGSRAQKVVLTRAKELHKLGDLEGSRVWQQLATELDSSERNKL